MITDFKSFNENTTDEYDKFFKVAVRELEGTKRFPLRFFPALAESVRNKTGHVKENSIPKDLLQACEDAIVYVFFGNVEPEWETDEQWEAWENLKTNVSLQKDDGTMKNRTPYSDKSLSFIRWNPGYNVPELSLGN